MRILPLTNSVIQRILRNRRSIDRAAERVAARIVNDVRKRGDRALFAWAHKFDGVALNSKTVRIGRSELKQAERRVSREFLAAVDHAARNIRALARRQRPSVWSFGIEPGVRVGQRVITDRFGRLLRARREIFAGLDASDDGDSGARSWCGAHCRSKPPALGRIARCRVATESRHVLSRRWCAGHRRSRLRNELHRRRQQNLWPRQSFRYRRQTFGKRRVLDRFARRTRPKRSCSRKMATRVSSRRTCLRRPSTTPTQRRFSLRCRTRSRKACATR